ncbi:MAG: hypothetical protein ABH870_04595 [bacterium]
MAFKKIPIETKVAALKKALKLSNPSEVAQEFGISEETLQNDFKNIIESLSSMLARKSMTKQILSRFFFFR